MSRTNVVRGACVFTCAALILAMVACGGGGGGSAFTGGGSTSGGGGGNGTGTTGPAALAITTTALPYAIVGQSYQQTLTASGGTPPYTWSQWNIYQWPQGFSMSSNGVVTATPVTQAVTNLSVQVTDSGSPQQTATQLVFISVAPKLVIDTTSLPAAHLGAPYDLPLIADGFVDRNSWKVISGSLPPGLQLGNVNNYVGITGTPTQTGAYPFTLQLQDTSTPPQVAQQAYTLIVDNGLAVVTRNLGNGLQNASYSATVTAVGGTPPYTWTAAGLPVALTIDANSGIISGVPQFGGGFQPTVTVTDSIGSSASQVVGLSIVYALTVPTWGDQSFDVDTYSAFSLYVFGGTPPYTWSLVSGSLPPGFTLNSQAGVVSGTSSQLGTYNATFQVVDSGSPQQSIRWAMNFLIIPTKLNIVGTLPSKIPRGVPVQWSPSVQGGTPPYRWNAATGTMPPGLTFDPNTADLTGTPTTLGQYTFVLSATDSGSPTQTAQSTYTANVTQPLGRNDTIANATPLGDGYWFASISPYADPPDSPSPTADTDYYRIIGQAGAVVSIQTVARVIRPGDPLDTVLELVDANGARLNICAQPGDTSGIFASACMNDDIVEGTNLDSQLSIKVPGQSGTQTTFYAHVLDWRGDARPDMQYQLSINGSVPPLQVSAPKYSGYGNGLTAPAACPVNQTCSAQFTSNGGTAPLVWTLEAGNVPSGMALDPSTGLLSGTPTSIGAYTMVVRATDSASPPQTAAASFTLTIENPPQISSTNPPNGQTGVPYNYVIPVTGGLPPYTWGVSVLWDYHLSFDSSTGTISGTPANTGTYDLYLYVLDATGILDRRKLTLTIGAGPFSWHGGSYPDTQVGSHYSGSPTLPVGGTTPYNFNLVAGSVPPGLTLASDGSLHGTPTAAGTYTLTLTVTDSSTVPQSATANVTITITP